MEPYYGEPALCLFLGEALSGYSSLCPQRSWRHLSRHEPQLAITRLILHCQGSVVCSSLGHGESSIRLRRPTLGKDLLGLSSRKRW